MPATHTPRVMRTYLVTLMPDQYTAYDPFFVTLSYPARRAAELDPTSSAATSQAFRAAIDVERQSHHTPPGRRFLCGGSEFVAESTSETTAPVRLRARHAARQHKKHVDHSAGRVRAGGVHGR